MPVALIGDPSRKPKSSIYEESTFDVLVQSWNARLPGSRPTISIHVLELVEAYFTWTGEMAASLSSSIATGALFSLAAWEVACRWARTRNGQRKAGPLDEE